MTRALTTLTLLMVLATNPVRAQLLPLGGQFQVNSYTLGDQYRPAVAANGAGNFVVAWHSYGGAGSDPVTGSVQAQRFDAAGAPLGSQFQVNSYTTNDQYPPAVAIDAAGNFVVVWSSDGGDGSDSDYGSVQAQRYDAAGTPLGGQFQVNSYTTNDQYEPAVAADGAGNFTVVWSSDGSAGSDTGSRSVQAQRFDATGAPLGGQVQVNSYTTGDQRNPVVAADGAGNFMVVWDSLGSAGADTSLRSVQAQRFDATGAPLGSQLQVNSYTTNSQSRPAVAADGVGNFVVAWQSYGGAGSDTDDDSVQAQRFDAAGAPLGGQFQVNSHTTNYQNQPTVALDAQGNFIVAWQSAGSAGSDTDATSMQAQRFDATGAPLGGQLQVNSYTTDFQAEPAVAVDGAGNFVVAWHSNGGAGSDQSGYSIHLQRYASARPILGKKILVKDPTGSEIQRGVIALGKETATDIGPTILGNPVLTGATLRVIAKGTIDSDQTYVLDAAGWTAAGTTGYRYSGPTGGDGDPVKKVILKRTPGGTALVKVLLKGNTGFQSMDIVPPNTGDEGGLILTVNGGGTYCVAFGGAAGGSETRDDGQLWKFINAGAKGCPTP